MNGSARYFSTSTGSPARTQIAHFEDQKALVVERFDRKWSGDGQWIIRLPREDMCQAWAFRHYENIRRTAGQYIGNYGGSE